jgi:hypothetical protein
MVNGKELLPDIATSDAEPSLTGSGGNAARRTDSRAAV